MPRARITITLPGDVVQSIDKRERNRSLFVLTAVERELARRRREELLESVGNPHPQSDELAEAGLAEWGGWSDEADGGLLDVDSGAPVRWSPEEGWIEVDG